MATLTAPETERAILGTCLNFIGQKKGWFNRLAMYVNKPEDLFSDPRNRAIYLEMKKFYENNTEPTTQQIVDQVNSNSGSLFEDLTSTSDYVDYLSMNSGIYNSQQFDNSVIYLNEKRLKRNQVKEMEKLIADMKSNGDEFGSSDVAQRLGDIVDNTEVIEETKTFSEVYQEVKERDAPTWRITTDIQRLDQVLGGKGFEAGTLTTIAARPKVGKTVFMNSLIHTVLEHDGIPIALNYETKDIEFLSKMIARHEIYANEDTVIDLNYDEYGNMIDTGNNFSWSVIKDYLANDISSSHHDFESVEDVVMDNSKGFTKEHKMLIEDGEKWAEKQEWYVSFDKRMSMKGIEMLVKKVKEKNVENPKIVLFVDYVQLQVTDSSKEREQISDLTKFYKRLAGEFNIAVIILAQINREGTEDPQVEHLKSSGSLEQDSDVVLLLSKAKRAGEILNDHIKINAGTTRLGQGDIFNVFFDHSLNLVSEADKDKEDIESVDVKDFTDDGVGYEKKSQRKQ